MDAPRDRKRTHWLLAIGLLAALCVSLVHYSGGFQRLEWISYDARMQLARADATPHPDLEVILIDEASLEHLNPLLGRFPWPRDVYAELLEFLAYGNPRAVVFDILFTENQWQNGDSHQGMSVADRELVRATAAAGNVHHAMQILRETPDDDGVPIPLSPLPEALGMRHGLNGAEGFPRGEGNHYTLPFDGLHQAAAGLGVVGMDPDRDGVYRRLSPFEAYGDQVLPSLAVSPLMAEHASAKMAPDERSINLGTQSIPLDSSGRALINFHGSHSAYSIAALFHSLEQIRRGDLANLRVDPAEFEDKIVFIGGSAVGLHDIKQTPLSSRTPGVAMHMSLASNVLEEDFLHPAPYWMTPLLIGVLSLLTSLAFRQPRLYQQLGLPVLLVMGYAAVTLWLFHNNRVLELVAPTSGALLSGLGTLAYVSATEGRDKRRVRRMLSQYVSPAVLAEVVDQPEEHIHAGVGSTERMTLLFSDIRGFTSLSEGYSAERVVEVLNLYFSEMTDAIFEQNGTLDKFIGDAIMAFWGAPIRVADHADRAVLAAMAMQRRLAELNQRLSEMDFPALRTGIGLHTGEVVLGNIGSEKKLDYTVIGDNVNLGSRIEGLTSKYRCSILLSEASFEALTLDIPCALVDRVRVKGKQQAIGIYRPLAVPDDSGDALKQARSIQQATEAAWRHYRAREWDQAIACWQQLPEDDPVRAIFLERCETFRRDGVPEDWDGIQTLDSK